MFSGASWNLTTLDVSLCCAASGSVPSRAAFGASSRGVDPAESVVSEQLLSSSSHFAATA